MAAKVELPEAIRTGLDFGLFSGLARRLTLVFGSFVCILVISLIALNTITQVGLVQQRLEERASHYLTLASEISLRFLIEGRPAELEVVYDDIGLQLEVDRIYLIDADGMMFADSRSGDELHFLDTVNDPLADKARQERQILEESVAGIRRIAYPIILGGVDYGTVRLDLNEEHSRGEISAVLIRNGLGGIFFLIIGLFVIAVVSRRMTRPLIALTVASRRAAAGHLDQSITVATNDEIETLAISFNLMLANLRESISRANDVAYRDQVTGLPNRAWFSEELEHQLQLANSTGRQVAIIFLDLDGFKEINDVHGHHTGDLLLSAFAQRLEKTILDAGLPLIGIEQTQSRPANGTCGETSIARLGGDEFTIISDTCGVEQLADAIVIAMREPFEVTERKLVVTSSLGIAAFPTNAKNAKDLLKCADIAMYQAKSAGRDCWTMYDVHHHNEEIEQRTLENDIRVAAARDEFVVYLQPQFDVATGVLTGAEALLRWRHPENGLIPPDRFIQAAKKIGLMPTIGASAIRQAISSAIQIHGALSSPFTLAINVSVDELLDDGFVENLVTYIEFAELPPGSIEIEITEDTAMQSSSDIDMRIDTLRSTKARLAIDDFGVGYSNLVRLKNMAFETLKIDRSLTEELGDDESAVALFLSILEMAASINAEVVAEGIENSTQLSFLKKHGCNYYQGYFGGKPMPVDQFIACFVTDTDQAALSQLRAS